MTRNFTSEPRAISLPPLSELPLAESLANEQNCPSLKYENLNTAADSSTPDKSTSELRGSHRADNCEDLGISEGMFPGCSESDLFSPANIDINLANNRYTKHSPSECGSALTDEDSGCHLQYCAGSTRNFQKGKLLRASSFSALESRSVYGFGTRDEFIMAMTEDLAEWLSRLYPDMAAELDADNFFDRLSDGVLLCHHASEIHLRLEHFFSKENGEFKLQDFRIGGIKPSMPPAPPFYQLRGFSSNNIAGGSFWARDNVASFLKWCRSMRLPDSILFETEDLVSRKNVRSVIVCLLELARFGGRLGIEVPDIIYLEKEIDDEIAAETMSLNYDGSATEAYRRETQTTECEIENKGEDKSVNSSRLFVDNEVSCSLFPCKTDALVGSDGLVPDWESNADVLATSQIDGETTTSKLPRHIYNKAALLRSAKIRNDHPVQKQKEMMKREEEMPSKPRYNRPVVDMRSLDEMVRDTLAQCTCEQTFPMVRLSECRYLFGDKSTQIFVRILRSHVMVRVGGGWDTLNHFLQKYDECRKVPHSDSENMRPRQAQENKDILENVSPRHVLNSISTVPSQPPTVESSSSALLGQGSLQVVKRGREVTRTCNVTQSRSLDITSRCHFVDHQSMEKETLALTTNENVESFLEKKYTNEQETVLDAETNGISQRKLSSDDDIVPLNSEETTPINHLKENSFNFSSGADILTDLKEPAGVPVSTTKIPQSYIGQYRKSTTITSPTTIYAPKARLNRILSTGVTQSTANNSSSNLETLSSSAASLGNLSDITFTKVGNSKIPQSQNKKTNTSAGRRGSLFASQPDSKLSQRTRSVSNLTLIPCKTTYSKKKFSPTTNTPDVFTRLYTRPTNKPAANKSETATPSSKQRSKSISNLNSCLEKKSFQRNISNVPIDRGSPISGHLSRQNDSVPNRSEKTGSTPTRQKSVARMPVEGTRIPIPSKALMNKTSRSKSFSSQLLINT